jgi:hypothetical protein
MDSLNSIANNLRDPSWWFNAFIVGTVVSVVGAFLKDYLERRFNLFWAAWSRKKRGQAKLRKQERIEAWSQNEWRVIIVMLMALEIGFITFWVGGMAFMYLNYLRLRYGIGGVGVRSFQMLPTWHASWLAIAYLSWLWMIWKTVRAVAYSAACAERFYQSKGLPPPMAD